MNEAFYFTSWSPGGIAQNFPNSITTKTSL
jgi:hypothetical protein